jgi:hypothetical protein
MLRKMKARMALALAVALAPVGFSTQALIEKTAMAGAIYRPGAMAPHSTRAYTSGGELRVCNDGPVAVRLYISNSLTDSSTDSLLEPGRCNQSWGHMMTVVNDSNVPAGVWAYGSLGGRIGPGHSHPSK